MPGGVNGDEAIRSAGKRRVRISGRFFPNGNSAIDNTQNQGKAGWTVAYTSTGLYTLTLPLRYLKVALLSLGLQLSAAAARNLQWGTVTLNANSVTIQIRNVDAAGAVQDIAANAQNSISFEIEAIQDTVIG